MRKLFDLYCGTCGNVLRDRLTEGAVALYCKRCNARTKHMIVCNGGTGSRFRHNDYPDFQENPDFYKGQIRYTGVKANKADGEDITLMDTGETIHDQARFASEEKREIRRDEKEHSWRRKRGMLPVYVDQKK